MQLAHILNELLVKDNHDAQSIANSLNVSYKTVNRWIKGQVKPKMEYEIGLRQLLNDSNYHIEHASRRANLDHNLRGQFDKCFLELRESMHRWSKLSSNESIEELSKLLLAQIKFINKDGFGIEKYNNKIITKENASLLLGKLNNLIIESIPKSLFSTIPKEDFFLKLKPDEFRLLNEISIAFSLVDWTQIANVVKLDIFNEAFGKFLSDSFSEEKQLGQYLTPIEMVRFMVSIVIGSIKAKDYDTLINPKKCNEFGLILDPSCGVGSFIIEFVHQLMPRVLERYGKEGFEEWLENMANNVFVCLDKSNRMLKIAATNLASIGIKCKHIYSLNSLDRRANKKILEEFLENKVSLILTNPPFGAEFRDKDISGYRISTTWTETVPKKIDSELLFLERYLDWLKIDGQCIAVIPDNILTNRGIYNDLRKGIVDLTEIRGIISFPAETFSAAGTTAKTSVIHFIKSKIQKSSIYFAVCQNIGFKVVTKGSHKQKISNDKNELPLILKEYFSDTKQNSFGKRVQLQKDASRWDATFHATFSNNQVNILSSSKNILVSDVAQLTNFRIDPRRLFNQFRYIEISDIDAEKCVVHSKIINSLDAPSRARKLVKFGDVLASTVRPEQKKVGVVINPLDDNAVCTTGLAVLHPTRIEPYLLATLLKSDFVTKQLVRFNIGIAYPVVDENCFSEIVLPITEKKAKELSELTSEILDIENTLSKKREFLFGLLKESSSKWMI